MSSIESNIITFGVGPAGTGKSYCCAALAAEALSSGEINKIYITRPCVEAEEHLGFLPGNEDEKFEPYFRPLRDIFEERLGKGATDYMVSHRKIEAAPFAYLRGRAEPLDALLPSPDGPKRMGDIKVGDVVFGSDGKPTKVTGVFPQGKIPVADVIFADGSTVRCSKTHLWNTRNQTRRYRNLSYKTRTTEEIASTLRTKRGVCNHEIPIVSSPVEFAKRDVPIDPYVLGALIGDGNFTCGTISLSNPDEGIISEVARRLPEGIKISKKISATDYDYWITNETGTSARNELKTALRGLDLWGRKSADKFIPSLYLENSAEIRLDLLRGLMDTDGCVSFHHPEKKDKTRVQFSSSSHDLAKGVKWIVESLGGIARLSIRDKDTLKGGHINGRVVKSNYDSHIVDFILPKSVNPFLLKRKADKFNPSPLYRLITDIVDAGEEECQCISVEASDHLYLTSNFIVTHNTFRNAWVILDEAQNTTPNQMKLFLTRLGEGSRLIINGDIDQQDISGKSGLLDAIQRLSGLRSVGVVEFDVSDVVRHGLISQILERYRD
jgi:phosphate starvation-inducible PhoH-like protein